MGARVDGESKAKGKRKGGQAGRKGFTGCEVCSLGTFLRWPNVRRAV